MSPMQRVVANQLRPEADRDPYGVAEARTRLEVSYQWLEGALSGRKWAAGDDFTLADCAAAPALFYADKMMPLAETHPHAAAYLGRLTQRPSFARVLAEAEPYFKMFPER
jgi:glutathione S-transferase